MSSAARIKLAIIEILEYLMKEGRKEGREEGRKEGREMGVKLTPEKGKIGRRRR